MRPVALVLSTLTTTLVLAAAAPAAQAAGPRLDRGERSLVRVINHARARYGLPRLHAGGRLSHVADAHTRSMLVGDYFSHGAFVARVRRYVSFHRIGETLAMSSRCGAHRFVSMWLNSPPHREILLSRSFRRIGVGRRVGNLAGRRACMVTADFASRR